MSFLICLFGSVCLFVCLYVGSFLFLFVFVYLSVKLNKNNNNNKKMTLSV